MGAPGKGGDVAIVGAGPVGLLAANLLAQAGHHVVVLERERALVDEPRAVSIDDEAMRTLQAAGLSDEVRRLVVPGTGTRYITARGGTLTYANPTGQPRGFPTKNLVHQPDLVRLLHEALQRFEHVSVRFGHQVVAVDQNAAGVVLGVDAPGGRTGLRSQYVLGCDGGRSSVRECLGTSMAGSSFEQRWLVVDTVGDHHDHRYAMHHGDPRRPHVIIPGRDGRCRYEFLVLPHEREDEVVAFARVRELLRPYRDLEPSQMARCVVYTFHALMAQCWRAGRVLVAGDAAHMMPPFAGQGLNTGIRDVRNLSWKLDLVLTGRADRSLLDTYQLEREPHARAMIDLSTRIGGIVMTTNPAKAGLRDAVAWCANRIGPAARYLSDMRFKPPPHIAEGVLVRRTSARASTRADPAGWMLDQPTVLAADGRCVRLDEALGDGFALVGADRGGRWAVERLLDARWCGLGPRRVRAVLDDRMPRPTTPEVSVADLDGSLARALAPAIDEVWLVRPDRHVAAVFAPEHESAVLDRLGRWLSL
jgi:3-(3-hydroxy-phenyl)propionate hydroxylase